MPCQLTVIGFLLLVMALVGKCGGSEGKAAGNFDVKSGFFLLFYFLPSTLQLVVWIKSRMICDHGAIRVILVVNGPLRPSTGERGGGV